MSNIILPYNYEPRTYQLNAWNHFEGPGAGKRGVAVWHRRAGKDLLAINLVGVKAFERVGLYWHLLPTYKQGRAIVWNGSTKEGRRFLDHFPKELTVDRNKTEMRVTFTNGSMYQVVGTDDINSLVGTNPIGCVFSEYSLHDPAAWDYIRPILAENDGWALFIYTARGHNHGFKMLNMARKNPKWFCEVLVAGSNGTKKPDGTPVLSDEVIEDERKAGMDEAMIQQEFFCSFDAPMVGAYYGTQMAAAQKEGRIREESLFDPRIPVDTAWDLGMDDEMAIWFIQEVGNEIRVIDYYENSGEGFNHYVRHMRGEEEGAEHRVEYTYGRHYFPHDIEVRELATGKSRKEALKALGIKARPVIQHDPVDGIAIVRGILPRCYFSDLRCERGINALRTYRRDKDEAKETFKNTPVHDWASHGADAFRIFAMGRRQERHSRKDLQKFAVDNSNYLS